MDPVPVIPGFYMRTSIPNEVYFLEHRSVDIGHDFDYEQPIWTWMIINGNAIDVPLDEMRRIAQLPDFVRLVPENG